MYSPESNLSKPKSQAELDKEELQNLIAGADKNIDIPLEPDYLEQASKLINLNGVTHELLSGEVKRLSDLQTKSEEEYKEKDKVSLTPEQKEDLKAALALLRDRLYRIAN